MVEPGEMAVARQQLGKHVGNKYACNNRRTVRSGVLYAVRAKAT
jgi:hypothetical protein